MTDRDIFLVCNNVDELGGVQRWAHHLAGLFAARGHRVTLVGVTSADDPHRYAHNAPYRVEVLHEQWRPPALAWRPASVRARLNMRARVRDRRRTVALRRGVARLSELLREARPGGVVIAAQVWAMEWVRLADTRGLKVIGMSHESYTATRRSSRYRRVREFYAGADRMLALTSEDADAWARSGMTNADHIPNPLPLEPSPHPDLLAPVVACVGRLSYEKGVDMALEAWAEVGAARPGWRLRVYGSGPEEGALRELAASLGVSGSVEFRGPTADVEAALAEASVFLLPSRQEGFPMSLLEAMACGLPSVAFDCAPGVRELLTDGRDGLLVAPGHTTALAAALDRLIGDPDLRRALAAEAVGSVTRFRPGAVLDRWERLFALLHRGGHPSIT
ncbi:glycosyltransferase [Thermomonospora umbrina]|uniref:Glycosyltransferase involved in cell wall biosynthesis n=1 Tax=Thermomonospora umbrina TaxID=111806 RepID=A0A3D9SN70_9ACTN|nr:glycosyltransferase [Thermomonospora umbrina]REE95870.1 glycosyltransferase involved in cell wall biosynthesis [Thermomonospora umbrina]